ncbi:MAG: hypothetical protein O7D34_10210 [Ignavibacteria bacterium]|nr:hypothetical protein [Ignavibacteria bacterium]
MMTMLQEILRYLPDAYTRRARIFPVTLVALPLALVAVAWFGDELANLDEGVLYGLLVWGGITMLLAQVGRGAGKNKEPKLWAAWGGAPTTQLLRHRGKTNKVVLKRWHKKLSEIVSDLRIPIPEEEEADLEKADAIYEACVAVLREKTRDREKFPLVFDENCSYGFRRNLWGLKPVGIITSLLGIVLIGILAFERFLRKGLEIPLIVVIAGIATLVMLLVWLFVINKGWVKAQAEAYAVRLLESMERF